MGWVNNIIVNNIVIVGFFCLFDVFTYLKFLHPLAFDIKNILKNHVTFFLQVEKKIN